MTVTTFEALPPQWQGLSKKDIENLADLQVSMILEHGGVLNVAERISAFENFLKTVKADPRFTEYVREELSKNGGKLTTASGAKIEACETGVSFDYSNNPDWLALQEEESKIAEKRKALEDRLKKIPAGKMLVDEETGETLIGPVRSSKSSYKVTLAK